MSSGRSDWSEHADWMREVGATDAAWDRDGTLLQLRLGPKPASPEEPKPANQPPMTPEQQKAAREQQSRHHFAASGRAVMRVGDGS